MSGVKCITSYEVAAVLEIELQKDDDRKGGADRRPMFSIVVAVMNGAKTLQVLLDSLVGQSCSAWELIVMDGASTDGTQDILENSASIITYFESAPDRGIAHAWNKGLEKCSGEWVLFLGADDCLYDGTVLSDFNRVLQQDDESDIVYGEIVFKDGPYEGVTLGNRFEWSVHKRRMAIPHTGCFHRRSMLESAGPFDETFKIAMDYELLLRDSAMRARFVPRLVTIMGGGGLSSNNQVKSLLENRRAQLKNKVGNKALIFFWYLFYRFRTAVLS